jgi:glycosyltransferase involved in cell wall biosynthesis
MVLDAQFPPDIRVEKEAKTLNKTGYKVYILSQHRSSHPTEEEKEHYKIIRFNTNQFKVLKQLTRDFRKIAFYDPVWVWGIGNFVKEYHINILHVHDLPLVKTAYKVAKKYNIPVVADFHEDFPELVEAVRPNNLSVLQQFYYSYKRWKKYEARISKKVDRIITVVEEQMENLKKDYDLPSNKITVVHNTIDFDKYKGINTEHISSDNEFIISYIGGLAPHRGLDIAIQDMPQVVSNIPPAKLIIIGKGRGEIEKNLKDLAKQIGVSESVQFLGWKKPAELPLYFRQSNIGIIPHHHAYKHAEISAPNKLFEYMYFKVPLLVSDRPALKRFVEETKAGLVFSSSEPGDFARKVLRMFKDPENFGEMGYKAVMEKYNWKVDGENLINLYRSFNIK